MKKFWSFCALLPDLFPSSPVPTSEFQLVMFVSWLAQSLSPASVDVYLAAVRSYHIDLGYSDPTQHKPRLRRVLQGIHRSQGAARPPRRPITRDILCYIHRILSLPNSGSDSLMFWLACSLAFFGFLRVSKFTSSPPFDPARHLAPSDLEFLPGEPSHGLHFRIKFSKTDPVGAGHFLYNTIQYNTILFKHGKNLQFTNDKLNYILKKNENIYIYININTMNWFPRLLCGSKLLVTVIFRYCFSKLSK